MGFDPKELRAGKEVEMEHTDDPAVAEKIAKDHLLEDPHYYSKLGRCMPGEVPQMNPDIIELDIPIPMVIYLQIVEEIEDLRGNRFGEDEDPVFWAGELRPEEAIYILQQLGPENWTELTEAPFYWSPQEALGEWMKLLLRDASVHSNPSSPYREAYETIDREHAKLRERLRSGRLSEKQKKDIGRRLLSLALLRKEAQWAHKGLTREVLPLRDNPAKKNPWEIKDQAGRHWVEGKGWVTGGGGTVYEHLRDMPRDLPWGPEERHRIVRPHDYYGTFVDMDEEPRASAEPFGPRENPSLDIPPHVRPSRKIVDAYIRFHGVEPGDVTDLGQVWVPGALERLGPCIDVGYNVLDSRSTKHGRFVHDHKGGVKVYKRLEHGRGDLHYKNFPSELWVLGSNIGFTYEDANGEFIEVPGSSAKKICTNVGRNMLVIVDGKGVLYVIKGGKLKVTDWIYN